MFSRLKRSLAAFSGVLVLGLNGAILYDMLHEREQLRVEAHQTTQNLTRTLHRHAVESFASVDKTLSGIAEVLRVRPDSYTRGSPEVMAFLHRRLDTTPVARAILVVGADGRLLHDTSLTEPEDLDLSDRAYFLAHRDTHTTDAYIDRPLKGRRSGQWLISVSRRLEHADGSFAGVVVAVVRPEAFAAVYATVELVSDGTVVLMHRDGTVMARHPDHEQHIGRSAAGNVLFTEYLKAKPSGTQELVSALDGRLRIVSYESSEHVPLVTAVTVGKDAVFAGWYRKAGIAAGVAALGTGFILLLTWLLLRELKRRERTLIELQASAAALRQSEAELLAAKEASDAANQAKTRFLANMSHELRTPLNAILGFAETLELEIFEPLGPKQREYIRDIHRSGEHLLSLINDILDTAKIEAGRYELHEARVDLDALVHECLQHLDPLSQAGGVRLSGGGGGIAVSADGRALKQMLLNLLSNAIKFTPPGGHTTVAAVLGETREVLIQVADTGVGIPASDLPRVMQPFFQADSAHTRRHDGTGLGLPLVKALAELHGGALVLDSAVGQGTVATIRLPAQRVLATPRARVPSPAAV